VAQHTVMAEINPFIAKNNIHMNVIVLQ